MTSDVCSRLFGGLCLLYHGGHRCCLGNGHTGGCECACGASGMPAGARWARGAGNSRRTGHVPQASVCPLGKYGLSEHPPFRGERHCGVARDLWVVTSLGRARGESGHGLASFGPASDALGARSFSPALAARRSSSPAAVRTPPLTWVRAGDWPARSDSLGTLRSSGKSSIAFRAEQ